MEMSIAYLEQFQTLKKEADDLRVQLISMDGLNSVRYTHTPKVKNGPKTLDKLVIKRDEVRQLWRKKYAKVLDMLLVIEHYLDNVEDSLIRTAIREKYITGMTWDEVGDSMEYDASWIRKKVVRYVDGR